MAPFIPIVCPLEDPITTQNIENVNAKYNYVSELTTTNNQDVDTLNRKSFYESKQYSELLIWNYWIVGLYYVLAITLIVILFVSDNQFQLTNNQKGVATVALLVYPYAIHYFIAPIKWVYEYLSTFMPYNIYNNI
jgi:hypothetical protein